MADEQLDQLIYIKTNLAGFFFDAFIDMEHKSDLKITSHPVQMGANVADHAFMEPLELTMTVKMSECNSDIWPDQFTGRYSRSASALAVLQDLQRNRIPFRVHTRLREYQNMLVKSIVAPDDSTKLYGMEATVTMQEVIVAQAETVKVKTSKRAQTTDTSEGGVISAVPVEDTSLLAQLSDWLSGVMRSA